MSAKTSHMLRTAILASTIALSLLVAASPAASAAAPQPTPSPSPDPVAEALFAHARDYWRTRTDVPYLRYGALVRYLHHGHVFDNWWDAYERTADKAIGLKPLIDPAENNRRIAGVPFSIFGVKIFDTNPDAEPIRLDEPRIDPTSSFGVLGRGASVTLSLDAAEPSPQPSDALRVITSVESSNRDYQIAVAGNEVVDGIPAIHLTFVPLREPNSNRLRDLWIDPETYRTIKEEVQGILSGQPYDRVRWTVRYALVDGREYLQQLIADEPLHFGLDTTISKFEYDFVDYHFPASVPPFTFDRPF